MALGFPVAPLEVWTLTTFSKGTLFGSVLVFSA